MISRRLLIQAMGLAAIGALRPALAAEQYPSRPIRVVVPASPGTTIDATARFMAEALSKRFGVPLVVENRAGAGGIVGTDLVAKSPPDGYTLLFCGIPLFLNKYMTDEVVTYDPTGDFVPIALLASSPLAIAVPPNSPYHTLNELIRGMEAKPGGVSFSSGGVGSAAHICAVMLNDVTNTKALHVAYKGNAQAVTDALSGQVDFTCQGSGGILPFVKSGKLRALAVTNRTRWDFLPDVPTIGESGFPGFDLTGWIGVVARTGTPTPIVQALSDELVRIARTPEFKDFCATQQMFVDIADDRQFAADMPKYETQLKRLALLAKKK